MMARDAIHPSRLLVRAPRATRTLARLLVVSLGITAAALAFAPWMQTVDGQGRVIAFAPVERQQDLQAPIEGRATRWYVHEGSRVKKGDVLVEITDNDPDILRRLKSEYDAIVARRDAAKMRIESIGSRVTALDASRTAAMRAAESRVAMAKQRTNAARQAMDAATAAEKTAKLNIDRQRKLLEQGLASQRAVELAELDEIRSSTDVDRAHAALQAAEAEALAIESDRLRVTTDATAGIDDARATRASAEAELAAASAEIARTEVRLARQQTQRVVAPTDGTVLRVIGLGGEMLKSGATIATLVPDSEDRVVELWVDGNDVPLLNNELPVRLQFEGWPAVQFTGWPSVAVGTFGGRIILIDATDDGRGKFRILVKPDGVDPWPSGHYLRQGVRVNGWVLVNQVKLGYELWRRFNGFPPVVAKTEPPTKDAKDK
ncbi:MAG: HlyD family efflux transporter periplasmic adaptor subunit [Archangium sp.]|nr:HlyD family efflux transporter periplasmic adaptor subunit [Archangium sp.]